MLRKRQTETSPSRTFHQETRPRNRSIQRFYPDPVEGLTSAQVNQRVKQGLNNGEQGGKTKTEKQIIWENVFTFFNILNLILGVAVILVGKPDNALFLFLILWNVLIGSFQGIRSKRIIDKLSLISAPKATVIRDGTRKDIPISDIVLDDILLLSAGQQISSDCVLMKGQAEVNESLITGEADAISKDIGDTLLSGSFLVSGSCCCQVEHVGEDNYASQITGSAKYVKKNTSEIMSAIDTLIKFIGFGIVPIGVLLFRRQFFVLENTLQDSVVSTVGALVGMIPEGVVLLTSVVFAVSVIRLASHKTLVQDLYCVETLARVDTLCLDKTGTITEGTMQVDELVPFSGFTEEQMTYPICGLVRNLTDENPTFLAIQEFMRDYENDWDAEDIIPFSSARKWSGVYFSGVGSYVMGAGEFILGERFSEIQQITESYSERGQRVLLLAYSQEPFDGKYLPDDIICIGLILLSDKIRKEAPRTLRFFADQGVDLKVISGDNAVTVANIAKKAGLENADRYVDATTLRTEDDIKEAVRKYAVFGRVTPQQKLSFVNALKADGHTVAMTGDGVNDVLALKEADCSIAMASGSDAARTVSSLVLLDSNFASMPLIVREGRRSINNLQRSASLFLVKTIFSALIAVLFLFINYSYPFQPIQLTLISTLTIGTPSFMLALEPNKDRLKGKFLTNVLTMAIPAGLSMTIGILVICALGNVFGLANEHISTLAVLCTAFTGFLMLFRVCTPFNGLRGALVALMGISFVIIVLFMGDVFYLTALTLPMIIILVFTFLFTTATMLMFLHFTNNVFTRRQELKKQAQKKPLGKKQSRRFK